MQLNGTFDVKLGKSFLNQDSSTYMTMRCDFMPASVDRTQPGSIGVNEDNEVVVSLPNVASVGSNFTVFRGSARPVQKECILIYNKKTHELTLERIAHTVQLKKTREESKSDVQLTSTDNSHLQNQTGQTDHSSQSKSVRPSTGQKKILEPEQTQSNSLQQKKPNHSRTLSTSSTSSNDSQDSSSSSSSSSSATSNNSAISDRDSSLDEGVSSSDSDSTSSNLSRRPTGAKNAQKRKSPVTNKQQITTSHQNLIENDLKLSDSDSDDSS